MAHFVVMGTVVFGIAYGLVFAGLDNDSWWVGALAGVGHGLLVGVVFMPMMPAMHSRMAPDLLSVDRPGTPRTVGVDDDGQIEIAEPGLLGRNWRGMTPVGMVMGHAVYGLVLALVYGWIA